MPNFLYDVVALPATKSDIVPLSGSQSVTNFSTAADWNNVFQALTDLRSDLKWWQGTTQTTTYAIATTDFAVYTNATGFTVTLPAGAVGLQYFIKDITGNASPNITIATSSSQQIDGASTKSISSAYGSYWVTWDVTNTMWRVLSSPSTGGGSTGNYTFSANNVTLTGAATATMFTSTATGLTIGGTNLTSGYTITAGGASTVTTTTGGLSLTAAGTVNVQNSSGAVVIGNTTGILTVRAGSTGSFDMSAASGVTKTTTGAHTFGSASWAVPANLVVTGGSSATNTIGIALAPNVADGASSVLLDLNGGATLSNATADLIRLRNNGTALLHFRLNSSDGLKLVDGGGSSSLALSTNNGSYLSYSSSQYVAGVGLTMLSGAGDGANQALLQAAVGQSLAGGVGLRIDMDANLVNNPVYGVTTAATVFGETGTWVNVSGTVAIGDVCVWTSGTANTVARAAATANLTTIAGISTAAQTGGKMYIVTRGRAMVNAQAGVTVGVLVGTSASGAGTVGATTPGAGAIVGRALESTGATTASKVITYVTL